MELHDETAFDTSTDAGTDDFGADHDTGITDSTDDGLTGTDDHYSMIANDGSESPAGDHSSYGDSSTSTDGSESSNSSGSTVSIQVDGHTYTEAATIDSSGDAVAHVSLPDGDTVIAIDSDHDGQADTAGIMDSHGKLIDVQHEDKSSGQWIDDGVPGGGSSSGGDTTGSDTTGSDTTGSDPSGDGTDTTGTDPSTDSSGGSSTSTGGDSTDSTTGTDPSTDPSTDSGGDSSTSSDGSDGAAAGTTAAGQISVEAGGHEYNAAETVDVNQDGHADSGVVEADGKTYLLTDFDGDGHADHVEVGQDGQWKGGYSISPDGQFTPDPGTTPDESDIPGGSSYAVDPQTGEWVSGN